MENLLHGVIGGWGVRSLWQEEGTIAGLWHEGQARSMVLSPKLYSNGFTDRAEPRSRYEREDIPHLSYDSDNQT